MSNPDFPHSYRPGRRAEGRPAGLPDRGTSFPSRPGSSDGYARASQAGGRGLGGLGGYGRSSGRPPSGGRPGGQHSSRSLWGALWGGGSRRGAAAAASGGRSGVREDRYGAPGPGGRTGVREDRYGAPGPGGRSGYRDGGESPWGTRGATRSRSGSRFGTGVRDIRDDLRERLRRNGVDGDWGEPERRPSRRRGRGGGDWDGPGGPGAREPRRKGSWWRHWTWKKALTVAAAAFGVFLITVAAGVAYAYSKTPIPNPQASVTYQASKVYFSDGKTEVGQFGTLNRVILTYNQIPMVMQNAAVAAEDKNFWHEGGISPTGILRAAYYDLTSSGSGNLQGGSTITQELVRNYYDGIGTAQTLSRKIKEIFVAEKLARVESKQWIMQQYLNTVPFGGNVYGVGAAAQYYFGLSPNHLNKMTAAQAAMIAAMAQSPSYYSPDPKAGSAYGALVFRWKYVLSQMKNLGFLSPQDYAQAIKKFPTVVPPPNNTWNGYRGYIMQAVLNELENTYGYSLQRINTAGLHIVTTVNKDLMNKLYSTVRSADGVMRRCQPPAILASAALAPNCKGLPKYVRAGALLEDVHNGAILAWYGGPNYNKQHCNCQYDNALQSRNQVGSSFKTYVLATAVKQGMSVLTSHLDGDSPLWIPPDSAPTAFAKPGSQTPGPGYYQVYNDESGNNSFGAVKVQEATALSLNTAYTDLWHRVAYDAATGRHPVTDMAKAFGVDTVLSGMVGGPNPMQDEAGIALGQASLTVEEQATTIATIADNGLYHSPHVIKDIIVGNSVTPAKITTRTVLTPNQAADVAWALSADTVNGGTAAGLGMDNGQPVIAKTGTTNLSQSAFFMAATPKYAMADALFVNKPHCPQKVASQCSSTQALSFEPPPGVQTLFGVGDLSGYGGQYPAYIWHQFFNRVFSNVAIQQFPPVNGDGQPWNLYGALPKPKHDHNPGGGGQGGQGCQGQGQGRGHCPKGGGQPTPTAQPTPTGNPTPTATATLPSGQQPAANSTSSRSGGSGAGALALALVVVAGPSLPVVSRLRRRRSRGRKPAPPPPGG